MFISYVHMVNYGVFFTRSNPYLSICLVSWHFHSGHSPPTIQQHVTVVFTDWDARHTNTLTQNSKFLYVQTGVSYSRLPFQLPTTTLPQILVPILPPPPSPQDNFFDQIPQGAIDPEKWLPSGLISCPPRNPRL